MIMEHSTRVGAIQSINLSKVSPAVFEEKRLLKQRKTRPGIYLYFSFSNHKLFWVNISRV